MKKRLDLHLKRRLHCYCPRNTHCHFRKLSLQLKSYLSIEICISRLLLILSSEKLSLILLNNLKKSIHLRVFLVGTQRMSVCFRSKPENQFLPLNARGWLVLGLLGCWLQLTWTRQVFREKMQFLKLSRDMRDNRGCDTHWVAVAEYHWFGERKCSYQSS